jgi:hypothetical protein
MVVLRHHRHRKVAVGLTVAGVACLAASLVLTFAKSGSTSATTVAVTGADASPTGFLNELGAALRSGNVGFLQSHLDPAVLQVSGNQACATHLAALKDPTASFQVRSIGSPSTYVYAAGGQSLSIPNTIPVSVVYTQKGVPTNTTVHLARLPSGALAWFTACT